MKLLFVLAAMFAAPAVAHSQNMPTPVGSGDFMDVPLQEAQLGQLLFYDPILSGNQQTACATCHHPAFGTSDAVSLSFGDGGLGLGPNRRADPQNMPEERIPRNSPVLFNLGAHEFTTLFHDGRLEQDMSQPSGMRTPMGGDMLAGFTSVLSAQTMFPVLSRDEMAGSFDENQIGRLVRQGIITGKGGAWDVLSRRVSDIPTYAEMFIATYDHINGPEDIAFTDISNAIAGFVAYEWRSDTAPFDQLLRGEITFDGPAKAGLALFYEDGRCSSCHSGAFLTDHQFHAMGTPQIGPGKSASFEDHHRDDGRFRVTGREEDRFAFRTPSLRNIMLSAPYGHAGAHKDIAAFLASHTDPLRGLAQYDLEQAILPPYAAEDFTVMDDPAQRGAIAQAVAFQPAPLGEEQIAALVAFLETLTDPISISGRLGVPETLPSGLPVPNPE